MARDAKQPSVFDHLEKGEHVVGSAWGYSDAIQAKIARMHYTVFVNCKGTRLVFSPHNKRWYVVASKIPVVR